MIGRLKKTPLHPQWFAFFREGRSPRSTCAHLDGFVVDIGCADAMPRLALTAILLLVPVLGVNCVAWLVAALSRSDATMPYAYR
ncbi:MAG: hypothetical protein OER22_15245, partial [Gammaproteobacteria bacterium]|nr:hypothetical protein [Gammaproteobacteria bacterium]